MNSLQLFGVCLFESREKCKENISYRVMIHFRHGRSFNYALCVGTSLHQQQMLLVQMANSFSSSCVWFFLLQFNSSFSLYLGIHSAKSIVFFPFSSKFVQKRKKISKQKANNEKVILFYNIAHFFFFSLVVI